MNLGLSATSDIITFDQNWYHLYSTSAGEKDLSNDAQVRVIGQMESEIVEWKTQSKISCHYTRLVHAKNCLSWWQFFWLQASPVEGQSLQQKEKEIKKSVSVKNQKASRLFGTFIVKKLAPIFVSCSAVTQVLEMKESCGWQLKKWLWTFAQLAAHALLGLVSVATMWLQRSTS